MDLPTQVALHNIMRAPAAPKHLVRLHAGPKLRPIRTHQLGGRLRVAGVRVCAAIEVVRVAVDLEAVPARGGALRGDADVVVAGGEALGLGDVVVGAIRLDLVADGDGGVDGGGEGGGEK